MSSQEYIDEAGKSAGLEIWRIEEGFYINLINKVF